MLSSHMGDLNECVNTDNAQIEKCNELTESDFGILFDIDGVIMRGNQALSQAVEAFKLLRKQESNELRIPVAFVTNGCGSTIEKAHLISKLLDVHIDCEQIIQAPSPLALFSEYHNKRALFIGQDHTLDIAHELGFTNVVTIEELNEAYPLLDMVDHEKRRHNALHRPQGKSMERIEVIVLIGEPVRWESSLQILIDLLMTDGKPDELPSDIADVHLPILACNMDLVYMDEAPLPRFGHGAFLVCLETLYQCLTGKQLTYTTLLGKPSEITYRFAEHVISEISKKMGYSQQIKHLYFFGDNPDVDISGSNLYNQFLHRLQSSNNSDFNVPQARALPRKVGFSSQTINRIESFLVKTGIYKSEGHHTIRFCHRDFQDAADLTSPTYEVEDCLEGVRIVLNKHHPVTSVKFT